MGGDWSFAELSIHDKAYFFLIQAVQPSKNIYDARFL